MYGTSQVMVYPMVIPPVIGTDKPDQRQQLLCWLSNPWDKVIMVEIAKWKAFELPPPTKIVNQKQCCISEGTTEISVIAKT